VSFRDHFSRAPAAYRQFRPGYPAELYQFLAELAPARHLAWDSATGNGQAAIGLARHFSLVVATDASVAQLAQRQRHERIVYACGTAERAPLCAHCCDLITVAQAAHWFDFEAFYSEIARIARPGAVLALWTYARCHIDPGVDRVLERFNNEVIGSYWPAERRHVDNGYRSLPFPYAECRTPAFDLSVEWSPEELVSYVGTWSAVGRFRDALGRDPLGQLRQQLALSWPDGETRRVSWPLHLRVGRVFQGAITR
jgi:SAM-dependent methyltransferase